MDSYDWEKVRETGRQNFLIKKGETGNNSKPMGCSKSSFKREVYSNTILTQETRQTTRQPNFTPKTTGKRRTTTKKPPKLVEGKKS